MKPEIVAMGNGCKLCAGDVQDVCSVVLVQQLV